MGLVVAVLVVALVVGTLARGRVVRLARLPLRGAWLVLLAVAAQVGGAVAGGVLYPLALVASALLVAAFLVRNRTLPGVPLVALGLLLNAAVVAANGAMPVSVAAAARAGVATGPLADAADGRHELAGPGTRLRPLGDVVPVRLPLRPEVVSPGDVLLAAGLGLLVLRGMRLAAPAARG